MPSEPIGFHIMCRLEDSRVIAGTPAKRRILAGAVADKIPRGALLAFNAADTHLHLELALDQLGCREVMRQLLITLHYRLKLGAPFQRARLKAIVDQHHLANTFDYIMRQGERHGLPPDPWHEGSLLPDLLDLRVLLPDARRTLRTWLPRTGPAQWLSYLGVERLRAPGSASGAGGVSPQDLVAAAVRAAGCDGPRGTGPRYTAMRRALLAATGEQVSPAALAPHLGVSARSLRYLRERPADGRLVRAIGLQLALQRQLERQGRRRSRIAAAEGDDARHHNRLGNGRSPDLN